MAVKIDNLFYEIDARTEKFTKGLQGTFPIIGRFTSLLKLGPIAGVGALVASFLGVSAAAAKMAADLESSLRRVQSLLPTADFRALREEVIDLSRQVPHTAKALSEALEEIARGGVGDAAEAMDRLRLATDLADASGVSLTATVQGMDAVLDAFQLEGEEGADAMRKIFAASQGRVPLEELLSLFGRAGTTLRALGVDFDTITAALVTMGDAAIPARRAATTLVEVMSRLGAATDEERRAAKEMGIEWTEAAFRAQGLGQFMKTLADRTGGSIEAFEKLGIAGTHVAGVMVLGKTHAEQFATTVVSAAEATDRLATAAALTREGANELATILKNQLAAEMLNLGNAVLPFVIKGLKVFNDVLGDLNGRLATVRAHTSATTLREFGAAMSDAADRTTRTTEETDRLRDAFVKTLRGFQDGKLALDRLSATDLAQLINGLNLARTEIGFMPRSLQVTKHAARELEDVYGDLTGRLHTLFQAEVERGRAAAAAEAAAAAAAAGGAEGRQEIALDELRTLVTIGQRSKAELLERLRAEIAAIETFTEEKAKFLVEVFNLEKELADQRGAVLQQEQDLRADTLAFLAQATTTMVDDAEMALAEFERRVAEVKVDLPTLDPGDVLAKRLAALRDAVATAKITEPLQQELDAVEERLGSFATVSLGDLGTLGATVAATIAAAEEELKGEGLSEARRTAINALLKRAIALRTQLADLAHGEAEGDKQTKEEEADRERQRKQAQQQRMLNLAQGIETATRGALDLANAFGVVDEATAKVIENVGQIASGVAMLAGGQILPGLLAIGGGLAQLLGGGPSPEEQRRAQVLEENTEALGRLTRQLGEFGLDVTGRQFEGVGEAIRAFSSRPLEERMADLLGNAFGRQGSLLERELAALGLTMDDLAEVASSLGISFAGAVPNAAELQMLLEAIQAAELTRFRETFEGTMQALRAELELFDVTDPVEQFQRLVETLGAAGTGSALLAETLGDLDVSTAEGRAAAEQAIQDIFRALSGEFPGGLAGSLSDALKATGVEIPEALKAFIDPVTGLLRAGALGGLSGQDLLDALLEMERLLDEIGANTEEAGQTQAFAIDRSITEVTGSRIAALLTTSVYWQEQTARNTAMLVQLLTTSGLQPVLPPGPLPDVVTGTTPPQALGIELTVVVNGVQSEEQARLVGHRVGKEVTAELDKLMGSRFRSAERATGSPLTVN